MFFKDIKKMLSPSLSTMIGRQLSSHKCSGYDFHRDIACVIKRDHISACLKSSNPDAGGLSSSRQIWFFESRIDSIDEGFNRLTFEVSQAKSKYPNLYFFRWTSLLEEDAEEYVKKNDNLSDSEKVRMVLRGTEFRAKKISIFEIYSAGSWRISNRSPWQHRYEDEEYVDR